MHGLQPANTLSVVAQAVALVFDHISLDDEELQQQAPAVPATPDGQQAHEQQAALASGSANAALKLLDDLCLMASGAF